MSSTAIGRPTVLLLHAFPLDSRMWDATRAALEAAGYAVAAPDLPVPEVEPSLTRWAERILGLADGPLVPIGVSMGGYLAFELWRRALERITALVLADTRAGGETPESRRGRDERIRLVRDDGAPALWEAVAGQLFSVDADPAVVAGARELALEQGTERLASALEAIRDRLDSTALLAAIDVPVLVVVGSEDALTPPADAEAIAAGVQNGRLERIEGAGHLSPLERPEEFNRIVLGFLAEVVP